ncbi:MAG: hypothetical protein ACOYJD_08355 [Christensenellales bacterium]|jgi:hypothetical protein
MGGDVSMKVKFDERGYVEGFADVGFDMEGAVDYNGEIPDGFDAVTCRWYRMENGKLVLDKEMKERCLHKAALMEELEGLYSWFGEYDSQVMQFWREQRMGGEYDKDIQLLDAKARENQLRIRKIKEEGGL